MLALKGEKKALFQEFITACNELADKMETWNTVLFGALPYQLCYAFAGGVIQFFALDMNLKGTLVPVSDLIDLKASPKNRSLCLRIVVNCYRVLVALQKHLANMNVALWLVKTIKNADSSTVEIFLDHVLKTLYHHSGNVLLEL